MPHVHPANRIRHDDRDLGQRVADSVTKSFGSWRYLIFQTVIVIIWIAFNVVAFCDHFDPYPFILLNLVFSTQASYAAPLILLAQNRQSEYDRVKAEHDYQTNEESLNLLRLISTGQIALHFEQASFAEDLNVIAEAVDEHN